MGCRHTLKLLFWMLVMSLGVGGILGGLWWGFNPAFVPIGAFVCVVSAWGIFRSSRTLQEAEDLRQARRIKKLVDEGKV